MKAGLVLCALVVSVAALPLAPPGAGPSPQAPPPGSAYLRPPFDGGSFFWSIAKDITLDRSTSPLPLAPTTDDPVVAGGGWWLATRAPTSVTSPTSTATPSRNGPTSAARPSAQLPGGLAASPPVAAPAAEPPNAAAAAPGSVAVPPVSLGAARPSAALPSAPPVPVAAPGPQAAPVPAPQPGSASGADSPGGDGAAPARATPTGADGTPPERPRRRQVAARLARNGAGFLVGPNVGLGFCVHLWHVDKAPVLEAVRAAGFDWIKQQVVWAAIENGPGAYDWEELDAIVDAAAEADLGVILSVAKAPPFYRLGGGDGPPDDPETLRRFMAMMADRYAGRVHAYEIWNEANLAVEWGYGNIDAGSFVRLLRAGYDGVKAGDLNALVIAGALTPTGVNDWQLAADDVEYLRAMYAYDGGAVRRYFDALGAHPSGFNNAPDDEPGRASRPGDTFKGHWSFYFRRIEQLRQVMVEHGDADKQIWVTEFGWASSPQPAPGYEYAADISEWDQAEYIVRAYQRAGERYPWVGVMALWNLNFQSVVGIEDEKWAFGVLRADLTPRPAYLALAELRK